MSERRYKVEYHGEIIARDMKLEDALILIKGLINEYYYDSKIVVSLLDAEAPEEVKLEEK